jgi:hypothetical protein
MSKAEEKRIERVRKIIACNLADCGQYIELTIDEHTNALEDKKRVFVGVCKKCRKGFRLKKPQLAALRAAVGEPKVRVLKTTYNEIFSENE